MSVIEDEDVIKKIFRHLGIWEVKVRLPLPMLEAKPARTEPGLIIVNHRSFLR